MLKKIIDKIAEAVMVLLMPLFEKLERKDKDLEQKMEQIVYMLQNFSQTILNENEAIKKQFANVQSAITWQNDDVKKEIAAYASKVEQLNKMIEEVKSVQIQVLDSIPIEMKEERARQEQEIIRTKLEVEKMEDEKDCDQLVWDIKSKLNFGEEVIIEDNLDYQVIQMLLCESEIKVDFQEGKLIVSKKTALDAEYAIDLEELKKDYNEKIEIKKQLKIDSMIKKQIDYLDDCISQLSKNLQENPNQLPEFRINTADPNNPFLMSCEEVLGYNSNKNYFVITKPIVQYLKNRNIIFRIDSIENAKGNAVWADLCRGGYVVTNTLECNIIYGLRTNSSSVGWCWAVTTNIYEVKLHVLNKEEKEKLEK